MEYPVQYSKPFEISSKNNLMECFRNNDFTAVVLPPQLEFPLVVQHYFSWLEPAGNYAYLVFKRANWDTARGLIFRRTINYQAMGNMCDWCHSYGTNDQIGMLSVRVNEKLTLGHYLCSDLSCLGKLETQITASGKSYDTLAEQLCEKINKFYERILSES